MLRHVPTLLSFCAAIILAFPAAAQQAYPINPIRLILPYAPGGGVDGVARLLGQGLSEEK